jgi:HlyD family secretion protein
MIRRYVLPLLAVAGVLFAVCTAVQSAKPIPPAAPVAEPPRPSFTNKISGSGIVEASTRNIAIGTHLSGIVTRVLIKVGEPVRAGTLRRP